MFLVVLNSITGALVALVCLFWSAVYSLGTKETRKQPALGLCYLLLGAIPLVVLVVLSLTESRALLRGGMGVAGIAPFIASLWSKILKDKPWVAVVNWVGLLGVLLGVAGGVLTYFLEG